jgi:hypothetical protein
MRINSKIVIGATVLLAIIIAGTIWATRSGSPVPDFQNRVTLAGGQTFPVSLWIDPTPASTGTNSLTVQVADPTGNPIPVNDVNLYIYPEGEFPQSSIPTTYTNNAPIHDFLGTGHGYYANVDIPSPGKWNIEVHFTVQQGASTTTFVIEVED